MIKFTDAGERGDDAEWSIRSDYWINSQRSQIPRKRREKNKNPLILSGHGASLRIDHGALVIREGFTHHPQSPVIHRFFPGGLDLPPRIMLLDGSGTLSFDALSWLGEQRIALARIKWTGEIAIVASGSGFAADREKVAWQEQTRLDERARHAFAIGLIRRKLSGAVKTLDRHIPPSGLRDRAIAKHRKVADALTTATLLEMNDLRTVEGQCAASYFRAWSKLSMQWTGTTRYPIRDEWRKYSSRSSLASGIKPENHSASHPINAMLNYAYAVKLAHLQIQAIADGYDPTLGIMHHARRGKPAYIFDLIEPERPQVDGIVLKLIKDNFFTAQDFIMRRDGVCRLAPQFAKTIAAQITA